MLRSTHILAASQQAVVALTRNAADRELVAQLHSALRNGFYGSSTIKRSFREMTSFDFEGASLATFNPNLKEAVEDLVKEVQLC
jgi:hypothetical protein